MKKHYVKPQMETAVFEKVDVLTLSKENYVEWNTQKWFGSDDGTGYGPWDNSWSGGKQ